MRTICLFIAGLMFFGASGHANNIMPNDSVKAEKARLKAAKKAAKAAKKAKVLSTTANAGKTYEITVPELRTPEDSISYIFGCSQSNGLMNFVVNQLNVDTAYMDDFVRGVMDRVDLDTLNHAQMAYNAGSEIGGQILKMNNQFSQDYYAAEPGKSLDSKLLAQSILAGALGKTELKSDSAMKLFQEKMNARHAANKEEMYGVNRLAGEKFLAENKLKDGVITLPSGLQYKVIKEGTGAKPKATDKVSVNYEGRLIDGTVFDSSYKRNKPSSFQVNRVIKGWTEALMKMPVGSKWQIYIPQELAYGDREQGKVIKPYSALIFDVELLEIENNETTAKTTETKAKTTKTTKSSKKK